MKILTAEEMGAADRRTADEFGIPLNTLMEAAGRAVAEFCLRRYPQAARALVLCGKGNNGGDGFVAARILALAGVEAKVVLLGKAEETRGDAAAALQQLRQEAGSVAVIEVDDEAQLEDCGLVDTQLIVDAVVGTGFKPPLRGLPAAAGKIIAALTTPVVSVDLPSGWDADAIVQTIEGAYRSDAVVTFTAPKHAHVFGQLTGSVFGPVVVAPIGSPDAAIHSSSGLSWAGSSKAVAEKPRDANSNKGKFGHVLVVGGSWGKAGAPAMASLAALRTGAGLVSAAVPESVAATVGSIAPELMVTPLAEREGTRQISLKDLDGERFEELMKGIKVLAIGPGLGTKGDTSEFARMLIAKTSVPVVIDADALNAFAGRTEALHGGGRTMVLTPHPGEMARLAGLTVKEVEADRIGLARRFATKHSLTLVLKGWRTLIAHPDGSIAVNTSGNPAMAKGGSGDILTGIVAAMLAQFPDDVARAVEAAVYMHGLAADFAAHVMDEHTVLATDTVTHLSDAFRYRVRDTADLTWICGVHKKGEWTSER